jgi:hypothetical protein
MYRQHAQETIASSAEQINHKFLNSMENRDANHCARVGQAVVCAKAWKKSPKQYMVAPCVLE